MANKEIKQKALKFYEHFREHFIDNPDFERCCQEQEMSQDYAKNCKHCDYSQACSQGEQIWVKNENIIEELIDFVIEKGIQKEKEKLKKALSVYIQNNFVTRVWTSTEAEQMIIDVIEGAE